MCQDASNGMHEAQCVHHTALILAYLSCRGMIDADPRAAAMTEKIRVMVRQQGIRGLDAQEIRFLNAPAGTLSAEECSATSWLVEGMSVLAWALRVAEIPPPDTKVDGARVSVALGMFRPGQETKFEGAELRPLAEVVARGNLYASLIWRMNLQASQPGPANFAERLKLADVTPAEAELAGVQLTGEDLSIDGLTLHELPPERFGEVHGLVYERFRAFQWLLGSNHYATIPQRVN